MSPSLQTMGFFMSDINFCNTKEQLNHLGEVVTGKVDGSPTGADIDTSTLPYTGQARRTLPALESEYETSIANKEVEADAAIDSYRLLNKGPYSSGITLESKFEYITYNGESYFATNPPYTTTATTPDSDGNLFLGGYTTFENVANKIGNKNELSNSNFLIQSPDNITHPNATPESYVSGTQIFSGVYAGGSGCTVTLIDGRVNCIAGDYQFKTPNTNGLERVPVFTSSVSDYDGIPKTTGVSHALVSDEYVVTVTPAAGDVFSVKLEQGGVSTRHEMDQVKFPSIKRTRTTFNLAGLGFEGGDNLRDAITDALADGAKEIFVPQPENGVNYTFSGGVQQLGSQINIVGESSMPAINVSGDAFEFTGAYYSSLRNLILEGDGTGRCINAPSGLKNFSLDRLRIGNFVDPLVATNAFQGDFNKLNIERCTNGPVWENAYDTSISRLVVHECGPTEYSGRASVNSNWDISYAIGTGLKLEFARSVSFMGLYMEDNSNMLMDKLIELSSSGEKGVLFSGLDLNALANNAIIFDSDNGQVDSDIIFMGASLKADGGAGGGSNITGFNFGSNDSRIQFLCKPEFIESNGGSFSSEFVRGGAFIDEQYADNIQRYRGDTIVTGEYKFLTGSGESLPSFARREFGSNYQHLMSEVSVGGYVDFGTSTSAVRGFVDVLTPDGVFTAYTDSVTVTIVNDPQSIASTTNTAGSGTYFVGIQSGLLRLRNNTLATKLLMMKPIKIIA